MSSDRTEIYFPVHTEEGSLYSRPIISGEDDGHIPPKMPLTQGLYRVVKYLADHPDREVKIFAEDFCDCYLADALSILEQEHNARLEARVTPGEAKAAE